LAVGGKEGGEELSGASSSPELLVMDIKVLVASKTRDIAVNKRKDFRVKL
jgi:hypothetical protein